LRPLVAEYWALARDLAAIGGFTVTPDCFGELICCVDGLVAVVDGARETLPTCFLVGLLDGPLRLEAAGVVRCMAARLRPWAVGQLIAGGLDLPRRGWADATRLLGARLSSAEELVGRRAWDALAEVFDRVLMEEVGRWKAVASGAEVVGPFLDGRRPTGAVAREADASSRQVERRVRALTGTSPKRLACLARFQRARDAIWADPAVELARLAAAAGYADQPHMTREFRRYAGQTPARFARESIARKRWLAALDVAIVQEPADRGG
jgi:AraC-like DNA-binding protein